MLVVIARKGRVSFPSAKVQKNMEKSYDSLKKVCRLPVFRIEKPKWGDDSFFPRYYLVGKEKKAIFAGGFP